MGKLARPQSKTGNVAIVGNAGPVPRYLIKFTERSIMNNSGDITVAFFCAIVAVVAVLLAVYETFNRMGAA